MRSDPNPVAAPQSSGIRQTSPARTPGPWRDAHYLVVHPYEAKLPAACVKTGATDNLVTDSYELPFHSQDKEYGQFTLKIDIPLNKSYQRGYLVRGRLIGLAMVAL